MREGLETIDRGQLTEYGVNKVKSEELRVKSRREGYKKTELGWIPNDWQVTTLSDISRKIGDGLHGTPKYDIDGAYYFINGNNLIKGSVVITEETKKVSEAEYLKNKKELNNNTLFISLNGTIGNVAYYNNEKVMLGKSSGYIVLNDNINKHYIYYVLNNGKTRGYFLKELTGTTIKNLSLNTLRKTPISLPLLEEQQKIAEILSTVDSQIDDTDKLIEKTKELKKGLMQRLLIKGIRHTEFKKTEIGEIPVEWEVKNLIDISEITMGQSPNSDTYNDIGEGIPFFQGKTEFGSVYPVVKKWCTQPTKISEPLDILISVRAPVGEVNINKYTACIGRGLAAIRATKSNYGFIYYYIQSIKEKLNSSAQGSTFTAINSGDLKGIKIGVPTLKEQQEIANILSSVDTQIEEYENKRAKLEELKKGLMQQLLTGKIRVRI